jgi:DNA invertase Pin-like site-specific DNA recombinase
MVIETAKRAGVYTGRKPTAWAKGEQVMDLLAQGWTKEQVASELKIGGAGVYRIVKERQAA